jgi:3-deoxy-manno-octulosonate cytidylyltransferase (CMP-KDO synthetase)
MKPIVVIPARMAASRLPGKPLADIAGRPMIAHVIDRAIEAGIGPVAVAAGEPEIAAAAEAAGARAVLTPADLPSGTDRVHAAMATLDPEGRHDVVVNFQGDLPTMPPDSLRAVLLPLADAEVAIGTLVTQIEDFDEATRSAVVKAVCAFEEGATTARCLYFSRAPVPWSDLPEPWVGLWHHIGVYAFRRPALNRFVRLPPALLERREKLEQLRALAAGMAIGAARIPAAPFGVDTPADLDRARGILGAGRT